MYQAIKITTLSCALGFFLASNAISSSLIGKASCPCTTARTQCDTNCVGVNPPLVQNLTPAQTTCLDNCRSVAESCFQTYLENTGLTCE